MKAAKAEKSIVTAAVAELLDLKKRLAAAEEATKQIHQAPPSAIEKPTTTSSSNDLENLTKQVAEQVEWEKKTVIWSIASAPMLPFIYDFI